MADFKASQPIVTLDQNGADNIGQIADGGGSGNKAGVDANNDLCTKSKLTDSSGTPIDNSNPLPVNVTIAACDEDYDTASAIAAGATSDHDYAPGAAGEFIGGVFSASGCAKWELQIGAAASEVTKMVWFTTASQPTVQVSLPCGLAVGATDNIKLIRTNRDDTAMDVYSSLLFAPN